ncbi:hypothetical protein [Oleiagrimonas sp.]|jgi:hypothetical protein|uniref:hypothetical protein n=1 Tax=Oleiagrimonas sp. TaxID=2010330 RepID=UPI00263835BC|nr:hypothetical protein [Oleiagrimonas sp.]MDA3912679.1 hypothetical protein [Oleiagrimonas sp.]
MNLSFLGMGMVGVWEAALIALVAGLVLYGLLHALIGKRAEWTAAREIGWAFLATLVTACGADLWHLVYMGIVPMESPVTIQRILSGIHDPDYLGTRVVFEIVAASFGVMLGWLLFGWRPGGRGKPSP